MRLSRYFLPVLKENPAEAQIVSHRYMLRAGMIKQQAAGIYSWLPLGYRVLKRIEQIVHEEQIRAGHIPLLMPTLQPADLWREFPPVDSQLYAGQTVLSESGGILGGTRPAARNSQILASDVNAYLLSGYR